MAAGAAHSGRSLRRRRRGRRIAGGPPLFPLQHPALVALFALIPGIVLCGDALAERVVQDRAVRLTLGPGLAGAIWLLATHVIGRLSHSFTVALVVGMMLPALIGYAHLVRLVRRRAGADPDLGAAPGWPFPNGGWMLLTAAIGTAIIFSMAWRWCFHDEIGVTAHQGMVAELQRGFYPPRNLTFPRVEMPYHYGSDVAAAIAQVLLRTTGDHGIDVVTIASWFYSWCLFWVVGTRLFGRRAGAACALLVLLGGGYPYYCTAGMADAMPFLSHVLKQCGDANPIMLSYFFQHPWSVGIPLTGMVGLWLAQSRLRSVFDLVVGAVLLLTLAFSQFALWTAIMPVMGAVLVIGKTDLDRRRRLIGLGALAVIFALATQMGGFWSKAPSVKFALHLRAGFEPTLEATMWWHVRTFGVLLLGLGGVAYWRKGPAHLFFLLLGIEGALVVNFATYELSWDIVKFATVAAIGLGVMAAGVVAAALRARSSVPRVAGACALVAGGLSSAGYVLPYVFDIGPHSLVHLYTPPDRLLGGEIEAARWLRERMAPDDIMYRRPDRMDAFASEAGLGQVWLGNAPALMLPREWIATRAQLLADLPNDPEPYRREHIRFFVLDGGEPRIDAVVRGWEQKGIAAEGARFAGGLRVVVLAPGSPRPAAAQPKAL